MNQQINVLVVDDEELILECLSIFFEDEGFTVHTAASAEEALKLVTSNRPHVCITDMGLDGINGDEFILKAHAASPETMFLMHTGTSFDLTDELRAIGMTTEDILIKPVIDFALFSNRIRAHAAVGANDNAP